MKLTGRSNSDKLKKLKIRSLESRFSRCAQGDVARGVAVPIAFKRDCKSITVV